MTFLSLVRNVRTKEVRSLEVAFSPFEEVIRLPNVYAFAGWVKGNKKQGESQILGRQTSARVTAVSQKLRKLA